jgi:hypothetical protein
MTDRTEDNILWTRLTAVTAKGVYTVINIGHLSFLFFLHASVVVLAGSCITYSRRFWLLSEIVLLSLQYSSWNVSFNFQSRIPKSYLECHHSPTYNFQTPRWVSIPFWWYRTQDMWRCIHHHLSNKMHTKNMTRTSRNFSYRCTCFHSHESVFLY